MKKIIILLLILGINCMFASAEDTEGARIPLENYLLGHATGRSEYHQKAFHAEAKAVSQPPFTAGDEETNAVRQAALDYVEGVYEVSPERIMRSVHPDLVKRGFYIKRNETDYSADTMSFDQLVELAKNYNKTGRVPKNAVKEIVVFDVADQTASAKVTAFWGIDYLHLAKYEGKWKIINILWQTPPKSK